MPPIAWSDVEAIDSTLSSVSVGLQTMILGRVERLSAQYFGGVDSATYKLARALLAAHIAAPIAVAIGGGGSAPAGPVTSEREGDVSRSYAAMVSSVELSGSHASTAAGRAFDDLVRSMPGQIGVTS